MDCVIASTRLEELFLEFLYIFCSKAFKTEDTGWLLFLYWFRSIFNIRIFFLHFFVIVFMIMADLDYGNQFWRFYLQLRNLKLTDWPLPCLGSLVRILIWLILLHIALVALETITIDSRKLLLNGFMKLMN